MFASIVIPPIAYSISVNAYGKGLGMAFLYHKQARSFIQKSGAMVSTTKSAKSATMLVVTGKIPLFREKGDVLNIQVFGTLKCQDTKKAQRYFKERHIPFQFINLMERGLSKGEISKVKSAVGMDRLIDREGKEYVRLNLKYINHDPEEEMLKHPLILKTPIVRNGNQATVGYAPDVWKTWE